MYILGCIYVCIYVSIRKRPIDTSICYSSHQINYYNLFTVTGSLFTILVVGKNIISSSSAACQLPNTKHTQQFVSTWSWLKIDTLSSSCCWCFFTWIVLSSSKGIRRSRLLLARGPDRIVGRPRMAWRICCSSYSCLVYSHCTHSSSK